MAAVNPIARVKAFDVDISALSRPRDQPNLRSEVWSAQAPKGDTHR